MQNFGCKFIYFVLTLDASICVYIDNYGAGIKRRTSVTLRIHAPEGPLRGSVYSKSSARGMCPSTRLLSPG